MCSRSSIRLLNTSWQTEHVKTCKGHGKHQLLHRPGKNEAESDKASSQHSHSDPRLPSRHWASVNLPHGNTDFLQCKDYSHMLEKKCKSH